MHLILLNQQLYCATKCTASSDKQAFKKISVHNLVDNIMPQNHI